ncbi:lytic transglycosylase domain-containing protein [Rhodopseudomonas palustris]|uniref:Lytic transglycosylase, catalytic n=1 Tax=Rhodopseudomonas palustris (strain BisB18) TaxID=316056 RepID=Q213H9_RHOPB
MSKRHRWYAICTFVLLALAILLPRPAFAELLPPSTRSDRRVATVDALQRAKAAPADAVSNTKDESNDKTAKDLPASRPGLGGHLSYRALIEKETAGTGLAPEIAEAVMAVESGSNPAAIGGVGEIGLMQILPSTARMLGFAGSNADLAVPSTNIHYGVTYLARAWRLAGGDLCTAVMKYRAGHGETRFSFLSVNYCLAVRSKLAARGFRVTGIVPVATFGAAAAGSTGCKRKCLGESRVGRVDLAALNTRLGALVMQARAAR